jgi:cell division protein FtsQ
VAQIDIIDRKYFEIVPTVGNHIIRVGIADNIEAKFKRLMVFYKQVLSKTGFDKYSVLDAQYEGQVVGIQKGQTSEVDSVQLQKNIEELLKRSLLNEEAQQPMNIDSTSDAMTATNLTTGIDSTEEKKTTEKPVIRQPSNTAKTATTKPSPTLKKTTAVAKPIDKKKVVTKKETKKPKAVMQRRDN